MAERKTEGPIQMFLPSSDRTSLFVFDRKVLEMKRYMPIVVSFLTPPGGIGPTTKRPRYYQILTICQAVPAGDGNEENPTLILA